MKRKQLISAVLIYLMVLTLLPINLVTQMAKAAETSEVKEHYQYEVLSSEILKSEIYGDKYILYTPEGANIIESGKARRFVDYGTSTYQVLGRIGDEFYFYDYSYSQDKDAIKSVNLTSGQVTVQNELTLDAGLINATVTGDGSKWLVVYKDDEITGPRESIIRIGTSDEATVSMDIHYERYPYNVQTDDADNLWFMSEPFTYKLSRVSYNASTKQLSETVIDFTDIGLMVKDYRIGENGKGWIVGFDGTTYPFSMVGDKLELGQAVADIYYGFIFYTAIDSNGDLWYVGDTGDMKGTLGKLENGKFVDKYYINYAVAGNWAWTNDVISIKDENHIMVAAGDVFTIIDEDGGFIKSGWVLENGKWYYYDTTTGQMVTGWLFYNGKWYYLNQNGEMATGWVSYNGKWYYLNDGGEMQTGWVNYGGEWYYLNDGGEMITGWLSYNGAWYYLNAGGDMATGWVSYGGEWYYLNKGGDMATGWIYDGGKWYYLNNGGDMATGWINDGGSWYYLKVSGEMATGWVYDSGKWYYLYADGRMAANTTINGYKLGPDGAWIE